VDNASDAALSDFSGYTLLLVEDIHINREIAIALLEGTGINIGCAENGLQALKMFGSNPDKYDIILMDVQMPEMDGIESTKAIRGLDMRHAKEISIIAMTASVFKEDVDKCLEAGMNDHIGKPIEPQVILGKLRKHLHAKREPAAQGRQARSPKSRPHACSCGA
jgi:CheY-like chemotaxis protein